MSVVIPITGFLHPPRSARGRSTARDEPVQRRHAARGAGAGLPGAAGRAGGAGERHGDHDAAADDHGDDARPAGPSRRDDGQHLDRHLGRARDRPGRLRAGAQPVRLAVPCSGWCCRSRSSRWWSGCAGSRTSGSRRRCASTSLSVVLSAFGFGGLVYGLSSFGESTAGPATPTWVAFVVGVVGLVAFVAGRSCCSATTGRCWTCAPSGSAIFTVSVLMMHDDGRAARRDRPAADLHAERAAAAPLHHRPAPAAGRPGHGPAGAGRGPAVRPVRRAGAADPGNRASTSIVAVVGDAARGAQPGGPDPGVPPAAERGPGVRVHAAVHRGPGRPAARSCTPTAARSSARRSSWRARPEWRCW